MRCFTFNCLLVVLAVLPDSQAAPVPKRTNAKPAVIDAGTEKNIANVLENVVLEARLGVRENKEVAKMDLVRQQKDWESWLKKNLRLERVKDKNLVHVSFQDGNAKEQAAIINAVVDYYVKNDVDKQRVELTDMLKRSRHSRDEMLRRGKITGEERAKAEEYFKKREEYIRTLPALVEHAKAP